MPKKVQNIMKYKKKTPKQFQNEHTRKKGFTILHVDMSNYKQG